MLVAIRARVLAMRLSRPLFCCLGALVLSALASSACKDKPADPGAGADAAPAIDAAAAALAVTPSASASAAASGAPGDRGEGRGEGRRGGPSTMLFQAAHALELSPEQK